MARIEGDLRQPFRSQPRPEPGNDSLQHLNIPKGTRVRVKNDFGRRGVLNLEGIVVQSLPGSVLVELENDPLVNFRAQMSGGFEKPIRHPQRHFLNIDIERIS